METRLEVPENKVFLNLQTLRKSDRKNSSYRYMDTDSDSDSLKSISGKSEEIEERRRIRDAQERLEI